MATTAATEVAEIAKTYVPVGHFKRIAIQFFDVMAVMLVGTAASGKESRLFLLIASAAGRVWSFGQHVLSQLCHGCALPDFFQGVFPAITHRILHFAMATGIGFASGIGMKMYPGIYAECFAVM
jgi:hypothetical protein